MLSRERDGQLPVRKEAIHVDELLERLGTGFTAEARSAGVEIHVQVEPGLQLSADPIRLRQAVSNLVVNALQHTPAGGRIDLEARRAGASVSIEVRDSGRGFGAERVDGSSGTGLGLAIAEAIVRGHGGWLEVDVRRCRRGGHDRACRASSRAWTRRLLTIRPSDDQPRPSRVQCAVAVVRIRRGVS